jgi:hypothetical protein
LLVAPPTSFQYIKLRIVWRMGEGMEGLGAWGMVVGIVQLARRGI